MRPRDPSRISWRALAAAAGLGAAGGLRTATPLAVLQLRGRLLPWPWGALVVAGGAGELIADKVPAVGSRTSPAGLIGRAGSAAVAGWVVAGPAGAAVASAAAIGAAFGGMNARAAIVRSTPLPDAAVATAEDLVAVTLAAAASSARLSGSR